MAEVEFRVVGHHQIEPPVPIVVQECAAAAPGLAVPCHAGFLCYLLEMATEIVVEPVLPVVGHVKIFPAIIVVVTDTHPLTPATCLQTSLGGHVRKCPIVVVMIEVVGWRTGFGESLECSPINQEHIRPAIVIVIENGYASPSALQDVGAALFPSKNIAG